MKLYCTDGKYDDILEELDKLFEDQNANDKAKRIKERVVELLNERITLGADLDREKTKCWKMQLMIGMITHKLGKEAFYDALGIHEEEPKEKENS